jgi:hypothetical protein
MFSYSDKNMCMGRKFVQEFNGRRVMDDEDGFKWSQLLTGKPKPASLEIDLVRPAPPLCFPAGSCGLQHRAGSTPATSGAGCVLVVQLSGRPRGAVGLGFFHGRRECAWLTHFPSAPPCHNLVYNLRLRLGIDIGGVLALWTGSEHSS